MAWYQTVPIGSPDGSNKVMKIAESSWVENGYGFSYSEAPDTIKEEHKSSRNLIRNEFRLKGRFDSETYLH